MILALEHIHERNIIYRDLKPENVLIDRDGYIKITDFGLSRMQVSGNHDAKSICGTPEYLAPEIISKQGYGKPIDWWTLGCIIYEMLIGQPPFYVDNRQELFRRIQEAEPHYSDKLSETAKNLLQGLLTKDPTKRLGSSPDKLVRDHGWFNGINWEYLKLKKYQPPFKPKVNDDLDLRNFDPEFTEMEMSMDDHGSYQNIESKDLSNRRIHL